MSSRENLEPEQGARPGAGAEATFDASGGKVDSMEVDKESSAGFGLMALKREGAYHPSPAKKAKGGTVGQSKKQQEQEQDTENVCGTSSVVETIEEAGDDGENQQSTGLGRNGNVGLGTETQDGTVSEAASDTNTVSGGGEVLSAKEVKEEIDYNRFETKLNRSAVKYNRLPITAEFVTGLDLAKEKNREWTVKDHQQFSWPVTFHQEGGMELIRGWRATISSFKEVEVGNVAVLFRPDMNLNTIHIRICNNALDPDGTGTVCGDIVLGDIIPEESNAPGEGSQIRYIVYKGEKHVAFVKRMAVGAVRPYGSNPPRLELHHKAAGALRFISSADIQCGNHHVNCHLVNDKGERFEVKVTIRSYVVLRWSQPSFKRFYSLKEGDTLILTKVEPGIISASIVPNPESDGQELPKSLESPAKRRKRGAKTEADDSRLGPPGDLKGNGRQTLLGAQPGSKMDDIKACIAEKKVAIKRKVTADAEAMENYIISYGSLGIFLKTFGFEKFYKNFAKEEISLRTLATGLVGEEHLKEIGMPIGPRLEFLNTIQKMVTKQ